MIVIRTVVRPVVIAVGALVVGISLLGRVPSSAWPYELFSALRMHMALATIVLLALSLVIRSKLVAVGLGVALLLTGPALVNTFAWSSPDARGGQPLRIGHVQLQGNALDLGSVLDEIERRDADVFVVIAASQASTQSLPRRSMTYRIESIDVGQMITVITNTKTLVREGPLRASGPGAAATFDLMPRAGGRLSVLALHTPAPVSPGRTDLRNAMLDATADWSNEQEAPHLVLGDFNATPMSHAFRSLRSDAGLADSASGRGWQPTWPADAGWLGIPIDHVLHSGELATTKRELGPNFGAAHRSLWVTLEFA